MSKEAVRKGKKGQLAHAMARGEAIDEWARKHGVPEQTAHWWAKDLAFRKSVLSVWRRERDQFIDRIAGEGEGTATAENTETPETLPCDPEAFRALAERAVTDGTLRMSSFMRCDEDIHELEKRLKARKKEKPRAE